VAVDAPFLADFGLPSTVGFRPRHDLAVTHDFQRTKRERVSPPDDGQPDLPSGGHAELPDGGQRDYLV